MQKELAKARQNMFIKGALKGLRIEGHGVNSDPSIKSRFPVKFGINRKKIGRSKRPTQRTSS